jgi:phosphohistidine phosphatase
MTTNSLIVFRHAKSDRPPGVPDQERTLAKRGRADAAAAGAALGELAPKVDLVVCSPAQRARETWERAAATYPGTPTVRFEARVYDADVDDLLQVLHELSEDVHVTVIVGHNPGLEDLVEELAGSAEKDARAQLDEKFPTSAIAVLEVPTTWGELQGGRAHLASLTIPRG